MRLTLLLVCLALVAFAANSLLARAALAGNAIDAASFTTIRLTSGALALLGLRAWQSGRKATRNLSGTWPSAIALLVYAAAFSFAYLRLKAGTGALILFSAVQGAMILWGVARGHRPSLTELVGLMIAFTAFVYLLLPGFQAPDPTGTFLMVLAGIAWAIYSLRGRNTPNALAATTGNFIRTIPLCLPLGISIIYGGHATATGIALAVISGAITSGGGYAIWYRALPDLSPTQAAAVQLTVPAIAAVGAVMFLAEPLTLHLTVAAIFILAGVGIVIFR